MFDESMTWIAVGASALAALLLLVVNVLLARRGPALAPAEESPRDSEPLFADLADALSRAQEEAARAHEEARQARAESERAQAELRCLQPLSDLGATIDLEGVLQRALEAAAQLANAAAAVILLSQDDGEPLVATFGLSPEESTRELVGLPPEGAQARAVTLAYRYTEDEIEYDEFRLHGGLALPVLDPDGKRIGTLGLFWRRTEREITDEELGRLEALARALVPALVNAFRFEEVRRQLELDPETGVGSRRALDEALARECARARRYDRRLTLILFRAQIPMTSELLATVGERLLGAVRSSDIACHVQNGTFAVVLPEAALADGERLYKRLEFAVGGSLGDGDGRARLACGIAELRPADDPVSLFQRVEGALGRALDEPGAGARAGAAVEPPLRYT
jgi:GGDEF domain-containing protein